MLHSSVSTPQPLLSRPLRRGNELVPAALWSITVAAVDVPIVLLHVEHLHLVLELHLVFLYAPVQGIEPGIAARIDFFHDVHDDHRREIFDSGNYGLPRPERLHQRPPVSTAPSPYLLLLDCF